MLFEILIGLLLAGTVGGTVAAVLNWDSIVVKLKGKQIAVLGARGVGKTHLIKFLTTGSIPAEYKQTVVPEKTAERRFDLRDLNLKLKETLDVGGGKASYGEWKKLHDKSDVVLYLLRADRLLAYDTDAENRVRDDLRHIGKWLAEKKENRPLFFIIGTHCDLDSDFKEYVAQQKLGDYHDRFAYLDVVQELIAGGGGTQNVKLVLGSMESKQNTEELAYRIFSGVMSND